MGASQILGAGLLQTLLRDLIGDAGLQRQQALISRSLQQFLAHQSQRFLGRSLHQTAALQCQLIDAAAHLRFAQLPFEFDEHRLGGHAFQGLVYELRGAGNLLRGGSERNLILQFFQIFCADVPGRGRTWLRPAT